LSDASVCPLCGGPNSCVLADPGSESDEPCWCVSETFPESLIARVEPGDEGRCICRRCSREATESSITELPLLEDKPK
jgi:hypothetical protein